MTAPIRLTLPGPAVTADVTWDDVRSYLVAEGWALQGSDGGALWRHPDTVETVVRYPPQPGDPRARDLETGNIALAILTLARLADVAPGVMLARIAALQSCVECGMADHAAGCSLAFGSPGRVVGALGLTLSEAQELFPISQMPGVVMSPGLLRKARMVTGRPTAPPPSKPPALPLGKYEQEIADEAAMAMRERAAEAADAEVEIAHPVGAVAARHIAAAIRALPLGGDR